VVIPLKNLNDLEVLGDKIARAPQKNAVKPHGKL
jgi:hypothetical protein